MPEATPRPAYTSSNKGVPIYWLRGNRVADEYEDFYDGSWDSRSGKNQSGGGFNAGSKIWTGSLDDGTREGSRIPNWG